MENILKFLQQLDLSEIEAKLYLNLLKNGPTSVRDLAETIDIKRTTAYFYIDQLVEKGLVMKVVKGSRKVLAANSADSLKSLVEKKVASAKAVEENFPQILSTLSNTFPQSELPVDAEIKYYKGKASVKKIYEEALKSKELRSYVKLEEKDSPFPEDVSLFADALKTNNDLVIKEIFYNSPLQSDQAPQILSENERYFYKLMLEDLKLTSGDVLIYNGKVVIINYHEIISIVVLQNNDYYNTSKELFDFFWKMLPKPNQASQ